ncbi:MAG TPA: Spy/CpxP family protein refolding chaperone [Rhodanobacteraceae bacterium]|nr:Spy/CpxP family protein refolding chaperone [Rhodanobacteraceae bacterium]
MKRAMFLSTLLAAATGFSSLAFAATGAQTADTSVAPASTAPMKHGMHHDMHHGMKHGMKHHRGHHHGGMRELNKLDLTATQRTDIQQMMRQSRTEAHPQMQALMQKRMAFENATPGSADYQGAAEQLAQAEGQAAQERVTRYAALRTKIYNELTPEQRTQLASLRSERQARMQKWHAKRAADKAAMPASATTSGAQK